MARGVLRRDVALRLTPRGYSLENDYRSHVNMRYGDDAVAAYQSARLRWSEAHGLGPELGDVLVALREGQLSLPELERFESHRGGEGIAVCEVVVVLLNQKLVEWTGCASRGTRGPTIHMGLIELAAARDALEHCRHQILGSHDQSARRGLSQALSRVIAARNFIGTLPQDA